MSMNRRKFVERTLTTTALGAAVSLGLIPMSVLAARPADAFEAESMPDALDKLYQTGDLVDSPDIKIKAPDIAENGAVVPITVQTSIEGAESVSIVSEKNPFPLVATFALTAASGGTVSTRIKMGETSPVYALVKAGDKIYAAKKEVKVTIGGCGG